MKTNSRTMARLRRRKHTRKKISGTAERPRLAVFRSAKHIYAQLIDDDSGFTLASASTQAKDTDARFEEAKNPVERSVVVGKMLAEAAQAKEIQTCIFDRSGYKYWGRVKAVAEGAREGGLKF